MNYLIQNGNIVSEDKVFVGDILISNDRIQAICEGKITDIRMAILGGILGCLIGALNNVFTFDSDFLLQGIVGTLLITLSEAVLGYQQ